MKLHSEPLLPQHFKALALRIQDAHRCLRKDLLSDNFYRTAVQSGPALAFSDENKIYGAIGMLDFDDYSILWGTFSHDVIKHSMWLYKFALKLLDTEWHRPVLCAHIDPDFPAAKRLVKCLGFVYDRILPGFTLEGHDRELWIRETKDAPTSL